MILPLVFLHLRSTRMILPLVFLHLRSIRMIQPLEWSYRWYFSTCGALEWSYRWFTNGNLVTTSPSLQNDPTAGSPTVTLLRLHLPYKFQLQLTYWETYLFWHGCFWLGVLMQCFFLVFFCPDNLRPIEVPLTVRPNGTIKKPSAQKWSNLTSVFSKMLSCAFGFQYFAMLFRRQGI
jgi:hypothetical protein